MKVKIFTEGGKDVGLGHISRCMSLYNEVLKRDISVDIIINGEIIAGDFLEGINYINVNWLNNKYLINNISPDDYVIIDSYKAEKEIYDIMVNLSRNAMFIDDIGRLDYPEGIILNPSLDSSYIHYSLSKSRIVLTGPEYVIVRPPFVGVKNLAAFNDINRILITMGGTDIRELTQLIINNVCKKRRDIKFDIVIGTEKLQDYRSQFAETNNVAIHTNISATQMMKLMVKCDLAITAAGQTVYELLATQTPFLPIQIIENQENNIRSLLRYYSEQTVLNHEDENLMERILEYIELYNTDTYRKRQNKYYKGLVDGYGSRRIIDKLLEDLQEGI